MQEIRYYSTNNVTDRAGFERAFLRGLGSRYGLYMVAKDDLPRFSLEQIADFKKRSYAEIAYHVLSPFLLPDIPKGDLEMILQDAYDKIPPKIQHVTEKTFILWLTQGPTSSFKDYAARFFGQVLDYFLKRRRLQRSVFVATSGDTGGAVADALHGLEHAECFVFYPRGKVNEGQRRQMTTLQENVYAFEVNGDFDVCQSLVKVLLGDKDFALEVSGGRERFTSANSISISRLLPQMVYPFYAYSRVAEQGESMVVSVPSGNFGNMMGTVLAKYMGLPVSKIVCGVNENKVFPEFLETGRYCVKPSKMSPSTAMMVSHPSNLARLVDFYSGLMFDERDAHGRVVREGVIGKMPDLDAMRKDLFSFSVDSEMHYTTMRTMFYQYGIVLDPHGAVGWRALQEFPGYTSDTLAIVYETADPGKFPKNVERAIGLRLELPGKMKLQAELPERIYTIGQEPEMTLSGVKLSDNQVKEAKEKIQHIFREM